MKAGSEQQPPNKTSGDEDLCGQIESLQIRLKHIQNDYILTQREYEAATSRYLDVLSEVNRKNRELETLKAQLERRVQERTALLELSNNALRESEHRLQLVLQATSDGVWDRNLLTGEVHYNTAWGQMLGYASDEVRPDIEFWDSLIHPDDHFAVEEALERHLSGHSPQYSVEMRMRCKTGQWHWILSRGKVVAQDERRHPSRMVGTNIDITDRKRAEDRIAQAAKMIALGTLIAGVAHEINNPNNFIMLSVPILGKYFDGIVKALDERRRADDDFMVGKQKYSQVLADVPRLLEGAMEGARRIRNIVRDLREFARPDTAEMDQCVQINQVLCTVVNLLQGFLRKATANFSAVYAEDLPPIAGNAHKLEQVFMSLLKNAGEALPDKSHALSLASSFDPVRQLIRISIRDEGVGIPSEVREYIFDPFFTTKREQGNAGLGLTVAARIMDLHHADLAIEPGLDGGTIVTATFLPGD